MLDTAKYLHYKSDASTPMNRDPTRVFLPSGQILVVERCRPAKENHGDEEKRLDPFLVVMQRVLVVAH